MKALNGKLFNLLTCRNVANQYFTEFVLSWVLVLSQSGKNVSNVAYHLQRMI